MAMANHDVLRGDPTAMMGHEPRKRSGRRWRISGKSASEAIFAAVEEALMAVVASEGVADP